LNCDFETLQRSLRQFVIRKTRLFSMYTLEPASFILECTTGALISGCMIAKALRRILQPTGDANHHRFSITDLSAGPHSSDEPTKISGLRNGGGTRVSAAGILSLDRE
jgi:hypothetical protein